MYSGFLAVEFVSFKVAILFYFFNFSWKLPRKRLKCVSVFLLGFNPYDTQLIFTVCFGSCAHNIYVSELCECLCIGAVSRFAEQNFYILIAVVFILTRSVRLSRSVSSDASEAFCVCYFV